MKKYIHKAISHPLISGSAVVVLGSTVGNVFNYLFTLSMGRLLSVQEYGILGALISLFNVFLVFSMSILTVFSKFAAEYTGKEQENLIGELFKKGFLYVGIISGVLSLLIIIFSPSIANFLHISNVGLIILISVALFFNAIYSVEAGILQGVLRLIPYTATYILGSLSKFGIAIVLVIAGFHVFGATLGITISTATLLVVTFFPIKKYLKTGKEKVMHLHKELIVFAIPVLLTNVGMTLATAVDIILVKHFFNDTTAGQYAALSLMGRTIFFVVQPIIFVFFPLLVQKKEKGESLLDTLLLSVLIVGGPCIIAILLYFFDPSLVLKIFFPAAGYRILAPYLGFFAVFIFLYTSSFFIVNFFLSIGKTKVFYFSLFGAFLEVVLISLLHSSIGEVVKDLNVTYFLLLITLLIYYFFTKNTHGTKG